MAKMRSQKTVDATRAAQAPTANGGSRDYVVDRALARRRGARLEVGRMLAGARDVGGAVERLDSAAARDLAAFEAKWGKR